MKRHLYFAPGGQGGEDPFRFGGLWNVQHDGESLRALVFAGQDIGAGQNQIAGGECRVEYLVVPFGRRPLRQWRITVFEQEFEIGAEASRVVAEGGFAFAIERQMGIEPER